MIDNPYMIGVDWGTTSLRAYLMAADGAVLDRQIRASGILNVPDGDYAFVLEEACGGWMERWPGLPVLMCGMIGSRQGWREAPYLQGDAGSKELAAALVTVTTGKYQVQIVPGLEAKSFNGGPDVMRGEETILIGALAQGAPTEGLYCLPGTHSKWVSVFNGRIGAFSTFLTGEIYEMLCRRSILSALIKSTGSTSDEVRHEAFLRGLDLAGDGAGLLHQLFSIRARALTGAGDEGTAGDMLSGLLIGSELLSVGDRLRSFRDSLVLVASGAIADRYRTALAHLGFKPRLFDAETACMSGLCAVAAEGLLESTKSTNLAT
jgi:2-dehydro-3-deoxygalactonokinase